MTAYDRNSKVIAARKQYRADLKAGIPEKEAWEKANKIFTWVREQLKKEIVIALHR